MRDPGPLCHGKMALTTPAMGRLSMTNGSQNLGLGFGQRELILTTPAMGHQFMLDKSCGHMCHVEGILTTPKGHAHMTHMTTKIAVAGCVPATFLPKNGFFDGTNSSRLRWTQANQSAARIEIDRLKGTGMPWLGHRRRGSSLGFCRQPRRSAFWLKGTGMPWLGHRRRGSSFGFCRRPRGSAFCLKCTGLPWLGGPAARALTVPRWVKVCACGVWCGWCVRGVYVCVV